MVIPDGSSQAGPSAGQALSEQRPASGFSAVIGNARADGHAVIQSIAAQYNITGNNGSESTNDNHYPWLMDVGWERPPFFTGRREALDQIHEVFWPSSPTLEAATSQPRRSDRKKIAISGLSGAGKSAVALEYAYAHRERYHLIFLLNARTARDFTVSASEALRRVVGEYQRRLGEMWFRTPDHCQRVASALRMSDVTDLDGLIKEAISGQHSVDRFMAWLPTSLPWLLILDGYDDPDALDIDGRLPKTAVGHVLITSQNPDPCRTDDQVALPPSLEPTEGVSLLIKAAGQQRVPCCYGKSELGCSHAQDIVQSVGGLPLLIEVVGAYLREKKGSVTFEDYLKPPERVAESVGGVKDTYYARTFQTAFDVLKQNPNAMQLIQMCSLTTNTDIPMNLLKGGIKVVDWMTDNVALNNAVAKLRSLSLISANPDTGSLSMHPLVYKHAGTTLDAEAKQQLSEWLVEMVTSSFDFSEDRSVDQWMYERRVSSHTDCCFEILKSRMTPKEGALDPRTRNLAYGLAQAYSQLGDAETALEVYKLGLRDVDAESTTVDLATADMMNSYGIALRLRADLGQAEKQLTQAKRIMEKALPSLNPVEADGRKCKLLEVEQHLASILADKGQYGEAMKKLEHVLEKQGGQQALAELSASALKTQREIGLVLQQMGKLSEAKTTLELVYAAKKKKYHDHHPATLEAAHELATVHMEMGEYDKALKQFEQTLEKQEKSLGVSHHSTLDTLHSISRLYERQGRYKEALDKNEQVVNKLELVFKEAAHKHPWMLVVRSGMADIKLRQGRYPDALQDYTSVFDDFKERDMESNAWRTKTNIARVLRDTGKYDDALKACTEALDGLRKSPDGDPDFITAAEFCEATILERQGKFQEALKLYREVALKDEKRLGRNNVETLKTKCFVCNATAKTGKHAEALHRYEAIEEKLEHLGKSERLLPELLVIHGKADVLEHLAASDKTGSPEQRERCQQALGFYDTVCSKRDANGLKDFDYYRALHGKGRVCIRMGNHDEGQKLFRAAIEGWERMFDCEDHPLILMALEDSGKGMLQQGGAIELAHTLCSQALRGCEERLRRGHPQTCGARMSLGAVLMKQGEVEKASKVYATSLQELRTEFGNDHPWTKEVKGIRADIGMGVEEEEEGAAGDDPAPAAAKTETRRDTTKRALGDDKKEDNNEDKAKNAESRPKRQAKEKIAAAEKPKRRKRI